MSIIEDAGTPQVPVALTGTDQKAQSIATATEQKMRRAKRTAMW